MTSCENFLKGGQIAKDIEEAIAYNNAKEITVLIQSEEGTGSTVPAGNHKAKQGYDFEVSFTENPAWCFTKWIAVTNDNSRSAVSDGVFFEDASSPKTNVIIKNDSVSIRLIPLCEERIAVSGEPSPRYDTLGVSRDRSISVSFTKELAATSFIFAEEEIPDDAQKTTDDDGNIWAYTLNGQTFLKNISITNIDDYSIAQHFTKPQVDGKLLTIAVDKTNPIEFNAGEIFKTVKVTLSGNITDSSSIKMNASKSWNYQITEATDEKATVTLTSTPAEGSVYLAGTKDYSIGQKITLAFTENADYQFVKWDYDADIIYIGEPKDINTTALVLEKTTEENPTQIKAVCAPRLRVAENGFNPVNDSANPSVSKNSSITITFNQKLPVDDEGLKQLENITIAVGGSPVKSCFNEPVINENTITFTANNSNMLDVPDGQIKTVSVSIPADFYYKLDDGTKINYGGTGRTFDYKINSTTLDKAEITLTAPRGSGELTAANVTKNYSIGYEVPLVFVPADGWTFIGWSVTSGGEPVPESQIKIIDKNALSTKLIVYEALQGITVTAEAYHIFLETEHLPKNNTLSPQDSDIVISFNKEINQEFLNNFWDYFTITCDGIDVDDYFCAPAATEDNGKTIRIKTDKTKDLLLANSNTSKIVIVTYNDIKEKTIEENSLNSQTLSSTFSYNISSSKEQNKPIINEVHVYKDSSKEEELSSLPFNSWENEVYSQNHTKSLYITIKGSDDSGELKAVRATETYLRNTAGNTVSEKTNTTEITNFEYLNNNDGSFTVKFPLNFTNIDDGLYSVYFTIVDWAGNESLSSRITYYIKDTVLDLSTLRFGSTSNINSKRSDENGNDTVVIDFNASTTKETYYSSFKSDLKINGFYWGYEKNNLTEVIQADKKYTFTRNAYKVTYVKLIIEDSVGNIQENYIAIPPKAMVEKIQIETSRINGVDRKGLYFYTRKFYIDINSLNNSCFLDCTTKDNSFGFSDALMNLDRGYYWSRGALGGGDVTFDDDNNFNTEFYAHSYYKMTYIKNLVVCGCLSDTFTYYRNVENTSTPPTEEKIPYSVQLTYNKNKIMQNAGFIQMQSQFVNENQESNNPELSTNYSYVIKAETSSTSYVYDINTVTLIPGYNYKIYTGVRDSYGNQVFRSNYTTCNLESVDNEAPAYDIRDVQSINLGYSSSFVKFSFYSWPTDKSGLLKEGDKVIFKCFYVPLKKYETISLTPDEIEEFPYKEVKISQSTYISNGRYIPIPFDGRDEGYYNIYVKLEDASELHNYVYIPLLVSNVCNNITPEISKTDSAVCVTLPTAADDTKLKGFAFDYYDNELWKTLKKSNSSYYFFTGEETEETKTMYNFTDDNSSNLSGKFVRVCVREGGITGSKISSNVKIFYYDYYTSNIVCKRKNIIPEGVGGIEIICDQPTLVHTMYCSVNLGKDPTTWITKGMETGIQTSPETFTYSNSNLSNIPSSYYYTTIAHFADGKMLMTEVRQK